MYYLCSSVPFFTRPAELTFSLENEEKTNKIVFFIKHFPLPSLNYSIDFRVFLNSSISRYIKALRRSKLVRSMLLFVASPESGSTNTTKEMNVCDVGVKSERSKSTSEISKFKVNSRAGTLFLFGCLQFYSFFFFSFFLSFFLFTDHGNCYCCCFCLLVCLFLQPMVHRSE